MTNPNLHIDHLRLRDPGGNAVALKLGLEQALRQVQLQPGGLPPHAVLVIRRLESRQPFGLSAAQMYRWQRHVQTQLEELARRAYRPGKQYIPPDAESVLFYDDVELLVCYTRDMLARKTAWYWADLFPNAAYPGRPTGDQLLTGWEVYPQAIPRALVALKPHEMRSALNSLTHSQLSRLVHLLHQTYALPGEVLAAAVPDPIPILSSDQPEQFPNQPQHPLSIQPAAPWHDWLPLQLFQHLSPQAEYILGLCHTLVYRPQQARQRHFAQAARQWLEYTTLRPMTEQTAAINTPSVRPPSNYPITSGVLYRQLPNQQETDSPPLPEGTYTSLGGAIFLVNLLTRLQLPAIFPALAELNPWELLGAVTADLLGDRFPLHRADPLWAILNELAGLEPGARWGAELSASDSLSLPSEWLALLSTDAIDCRLERQDGRSRLYYQETDLLIADLPDEDGRLDRLISQYDSVGIHLKITGRGEPLWSPGVGGYKTAPLPDYCTPTLAWYVIRMRPFLTHFLDHLTGGEPIESILRQPATLYLSRTHVDLRLPLERISIPMRRAGLDRTPGWLPDFGYIVTIYFE